MNHRLAAAALAVLATTACGARHNQPADLAVTRVVLYQSGVAYIERAGRVVGDELVMPIRADQINDILTTLVVVDTGAGGSTSVSLPIDESAADRLADLPPELRDAGGLVAILHAFRGAEVSVRTADRQVRGRVVGVEHIDGEPNVTVLSDGDRMVPLPIADIADVDLRNASLSTGLRRSLDHSLAEGEWKPTDVTIRFARDGAHDVTMAYVVEQPIWKPAYRVVVEDGRMLLQGWAVIDNTSGVDWRDVRLSLTAGAPISFRYDLHSPIFVERPDMSGYGTPDVADLRPPTPVAAAARSAPAGAPAPAPYERAMRGAEAESFGMAFRDEANDAYAAETPADSGIVDFGSAAGVSAEISEVASMFRFDIPGRVTLPDQTSTMVTLVNTTTAGEDALIFQPDAAPASHRHPYRALLLDNSTPYPIQRAPIAIYNSGTFVGQGITPLVAPNESAVIPYALESRVSVNARVSGRSGDVTLTRIVDGVVHTEVEQHQVFDFEARSSMDDGARLYLKVSRYGDYDLLPSNDFSPDDVQREAGYYLVPVTLDARADRTFSITQVSRVRSTVDPFTPTAKRVFAAYLDRPDARPDVAAALRPVVQMLDELDGLDRQITERRALRADVEARTNELRQSIRTLGDSETNADLRQTLVTRLAEQDQVLERLAGEIVEMSERRSVVRILVGEALRDISLGDRD